jgi:hypothetical protein
MYFSIHFRDIPADIFRDVLIGASSDSKRGMFEHTLHGGDICILSRYFGHNWPLLYCALTFIAYIFIGCDLAPESQPIIEWNLR